MDKSTEAFLSFAAALAIGLVAAYWFLRLIDFARAVSEGRKQKASWRADLDLRLTWLCLVTKYARLFPDPWGTLWVVRAAKELEPWVGAETFPYVVVRYDPTSPTQRRYRVICE